MATKRRPLASAEPVIAQARVCEVNVRLDQVSARAAPVRVSSNVTCTAHPGCWIERTRYMLWFTMGKATRDCNRTGARKHLRGTYKRSAKKGIL